MQMIFNFKRVMSVIVLCAMILNNLSCNVENVFAEVSVKNDGAPLEETAMQEPTVTAAEIPDVPTTIMDAIWNFSNFNTATAINLAGFKQDGLTIVGADSGTSVAIDWSAKRTLDGAITGLTQRFKFGSISTLNGNGVPTDRYLKFDVAGNSRIKLYGMSGTSSASREMMWVASTDGVTAQAPAKLALAAVGLGDVPLGTIEYTGEPTSIYLYAKDGAFNIYYISATNVVVPKAEEPTPEPTPEPTVTPTPTSPQWYANISDPWCASFFGDIGGEASLLESNGYINVKETPLGSSDVNMSVSGSKGTISNNTDGLLFYYQPLSKNDSFILKANADPELSASLDNQISFGAMLRNDIVIDESVAAYSGKYIASGALQMMSGEYDPNPPARAFFRQDGKLYNANVENQPYYPQFAIKNYQQPQKGNTIPVGIKKVGKYVELTYGDQKPIILDSENIYSNGVSDPSISCDTLFTNDTIYAGLYAVRDVNVDYSDVTFTKDSRIVEDIRVDQLPIKTEYEYGEDFDDSGMVVSAKYQGMSDYEVVPEDCYLVTGFDSTDINSVTEVNVGYQKIPLNIKIVESESIKFTEAALEMAVRKELNKPTGDITLADAMRVTSLQLEYSALSDSSLQYFQNLISLDLHGSEISDDSALLNLISLKNLSILDLSRTGISDLHVLSKLTNLTTLYLDYNDINDISALSNLTNLSYLSLYRNYISDISALSNLTNLSSLSLYGNDISDISALSNLTNLSYLYLSDNYISDISALSNLKGLYSLYLSDNYISDISTLTNLTNLTDLQLYNNNISDISALSNLTELDGLTLRNNNISDISALSNLTGLVFLALTQNNISDISALSNLTELHTVDLQSNNISDISALSNLTGLGFLYLAQNNISDISALSNLTNLADLELSYNNISDISALSSVVNLNWLCVDQNYLDITVGSATRDIIDAFKSRGAYVQYENQKTVPIKHILTVTPSDARRNFETEVIGYTQPSALAVTICNIDDTDIDNVTIALTGSDATAFTLSKEAIVGLAKDETDSFTVVPNAGLPIGTYLAKVTITARDVEESFEVGFRVVETKAPTKSFVNQMAFGSGALTITPINVQETVAGTIMTGDVVTLKVEGNFKFDPQQRLRVAADYGLDYGQISYDNLVVEPIYDGNTLTFIMPSYFCGSTSLDTIHIGGMEASDSISIVPVDETSDYGDINLTIEGTNITKETIKVGERMDYSTYNIKDGCVVDTNGTLIEYNGSGGEVVIPDDMGITAIGLEAFKGTNVTSVVIPEGVTSIEKSAFGSCTSLGSVDIPSSVTSIGEGAFAACGLSRVDIPSGVTRIEARTFQYSGLTSVDIPDGVTSIGSEAFAGCGDLSDVNIPDSVTSIEYSAFYGCALNSVHIPNGVKTIGALAFSSCQSLSSVDIPNGVTNIEYGAFAGCGSLSSVTIPSSVTTIEEQAFSYCTNLTQITIPPSVTTIADTAFMDCPDITILGEKGSYAEAYAENKNIDFQEIEIEDRPTYQIGISSTEDKDFGTAAIGYTQPVAYNIIITNIGNHDIEDVTIALSGDNASSFTLSKTTVQSLAVGATDNFTIVPNQDLAVGTYYATVAVGAPDNIERFNVTFTVMPALPAVSWEITKNNIGKTGQSLSGSLQLMVTNNSSDSKNAVVLIGVYDSKDKLVTSMQKSVALNAGVNNIESAQINISDAIDQQYTIKVYLWDSLGIMMPLATAKEFSIQ